MKILVLSDEPSKWLWDFFEKEKFEDIDLIISCGDLPSEYLSFLVTMTNCTLLYVKGNHDHYDRKPPDGCVCIDDDIYVHEGVRIMGLGGSMKYKPGKNMYTEWEMRKRVWKLGFKLFKKRGFDILVTHSPGYKLGDLEDLPHRGFQIFVRLIEKYRPKYFVHGHVHLNYNASLPRVQIYQDTTVVNAYEKWIIEI